MPIEIVSSDILHIQSYSFCIFFSVYRRDRVRWVYGTEIDNKYKNFKQINPLCKRISYKNVKSIF